MTLKKLDMMPTSHVSILIWKLCFIAPLSWRSQFFIKGSWQPIILPFSTQKENKGIVTCGQNLKVTEVPMKLQPVFGHTSKHKYRQLQNN